MIRLVFLTKDKNRFLKNMQTRIGMELYCVLPQSDQVELVMSEGIFKCWIYDENGDVLNLYKLGNFFVTVVLNSSEENEPMGEFKKLKAYSATELVMYYPQLAQTIFSTDPAYHPIRTQSIFPEDPKTKVIGHFKNYLS